MTIHSLSTYTMRIYEAGNALNVDNFANHTDMLSVLEAYMKDLQAGFYKDPREPVVLRVRELEREGRFLQGRMGRGEYGIESDLFNTRKGQVSYRRVREDAELLPYYFLFAVPHNAVDVLAIFQTTDGFGVQDDFEENFRECFEADFPRLRLTRAPLRLTKKYARQLLRRGHVKELRLVKNDIASTDIANLVQMGVLKEQGRVEYRWKAGEDTGKVLKNRHQLDQLLSKKYKNFDIKLQLEVDGKLHTLNLGRMEKTRAPYEYNITNQLYTQEGSPEGRSPDYARLKELALELCGQLADELGLSL